MAIIHAIGTSNPSYVYTQDEVMALTKEIFSSFPNLDRYLSIYKNTEIKKRHFCVPLDWFRNRHSFAEKNSLYIEHALRLGEEAVRICLEQSDVLPEEIDHLFLISTTGLSTPSLDAHLINRLKMKNHIKRTPIWGLGCAGGAAGIAKAYDYLQSYPDQKVLVVAIELCSLTFINNDLSKSNMIATSLFADGAVAALLLGEQVERRYRDRPSAKMMGTLSTLYPNSLEMMGWDIQDEGLKVIFSRDIPSFVKRTMKENLLQLLKDHDMKISDIDHYILHPGGAKVLDAYEEAISIDREKTRFSREVIGEFGNMSSATVLFVLDKFLDHAKPEEYGVLAALGPGFSSELALIRWE